MQQCIAHHETGAACGQPSFMVSQQTGGPVCFQHAPRHYRIGDKVRIRQRNFAGHPIPGGGETGTIFTVLRGACYEVRMLRQRVIYYDWELEPANERARG